MGLKTVALVEALARLVRTGGDPELAALLRERDGGAGAGPWGGGGLGPGPGPAPGGGSGPGWDEGGAPTAAQTPAGGFVASFEGKVGRCAVEASSKREAYRRARREWAARILLRASWWVEA